MMKTVDISRQARDQTRIRHFVSKIDGARKSEGIGAAMALNRNTVKPEECAAVNPSRVHFLFQDAEAALREKRPELAHQRAGHRGFEVGADLPGRTLRGLERDIAREALDDDHVDGALPDGLKTVADYPNLIAGLQARGYRDDDLRKLLGGNLLRVWRAVEAEATAEARSH